MRCDEAAALTTWALADLHAAAHDVGPWTVLLDEFGAVISTAAHQALAILQRARSHYGQAIVVTQSIADVEALTNTPRLLDSLTDDFAAIVADEQKSPDSRDWLARLMGTRSRGSPPTRPTRTADGSPAEAAHDEFESSASHRTSVTRCRPARP